MDEESSWDDLREVLEAEVGVEEELDMNAEVEASDGNLEVDIHAIDPCAVQLVVPLSENDQDSLKRHE